MFTPTISGGTAPYALTLFAGALPPGRSISGLTVAGTYTTAGSYSYTLKVTDNLGTTANLSVTMTVSTPADTTPPVLSASSASQTGPTTATIGVTTNEAGGTLYFFVSTSSSPPSAANLKSGSGSVTSGSLAISSTGAKTRNLTQLSASTQYYAHWLHRDAAGNDSTILSGPGFTTADDVPEYDTTVAKEVNYLGSPYGSYGVFPSAWGSDSLTSAEFSISALLNVSEFNANRSMKGQWSYPTAKNPPGVWGYVHEYWKNYNATYNPNDQYYPSAAKTLAQINTCVAAIEWSYTGSGNFDYLTECFLTDAADLFGSHIKAEVGFIAYGHGPTLTYHNSGADMGVFTDQFGRAWTVREHVQNTWLYYTFYPQNGAAVYTYSADFKGAFNHLLARGKLNTAWFLNGLATGVEPASGGGVGSFLSKLTVSYS